MNEIKELVGIAESQDPTDRDRFHLKTLVRKLKQKCDTLTDQNRQMSGVIDALKGGRYNESESAKLIMGEQQQNLREDIEVMQAEVEALRKENASLKVNASKGIELQSAMQSNNAAVNDKIESANRIVKEKEAELATIKDRIGQLEMENSQ